MGWSEESRLAARIRERVANVVLFELQDPRIEPGRVTVTRVRLAKDLSTCRVFFSVFGSEADRSKVQHALSDAAGYVQREVGKVLRTRTVPRFSFEYDDAIEGGIRVQGLLDRLKEERGESDEDGESPSSPAPADPDDAGDEEPSDGV